MRYSIRTVTAIADVSAVITADQAKAHMRIDFDDENSTIDEQIGAAQERIEKHMARALSPRELEMTLDAFPRRDAAICIPRAGITGIVSVKYTDTSGVDQTLDPGAYRWRDYDEELLLPAFGSEWPTAAAREAGAVRIRFNAGYAEGACPPTLVEAVKRMTAYLYENREGDVGEIPPGVVSLCRGLRRQPI